MTPLTIAALSLTVSLSLDVPYLTQTADLCGGAAAAMVFRYWGDAHADAAQFAPIVDRAARGIRTGALADAVRARGWRTDVATGSMDALDAHLAAGRPVVALLEERGTRYHYVVVVGATAREIVVHDPSRGPSRRLPREEFARRWKAAESWSMVILPGEASPSLSRVDSGGSAKNLPTKDRCDTLLAEAVSGIERRGLDAADAPLGAVRAQCPDAAGPPRELAGVRFAQKRWSDAAALARAALDRDPRDAYALDVLGSSLFVQDDLLGALAAWNRIGRPRIDRLLIEGLRHAHHQAIAEALDLQPGAMLTPLAFERARRRLDELPDRASARLTVRPGTDGYATVDVAIVERSTLPHGPIAWAAAGARAAISRQVDVAVPGAAGQGDLWTASWRWWPNRPAVGVAFAAPRPSGLPGVWRFDAGWERESFATPAPAGSVMSQERLHGGLTASDWLDGSTRYALGVGVDSWNPERKTAGLSASIERRWLRDRLGVDVAGTHAFAIAGGAGFSTIGTHALWRSSPDTRGWVFRGDAGIDRVSGNTPMMLWPRAGETGQTEPTHPMRLTYLTYPTSQTHNSYLRAHRLYANGVIDLSRPVALGPTLTSGSGEVQRWFDRPALARVGIAMFVDAARTRGTAHVDAGGGLRVRIPGADGALRVDVARGLRDGAHALSVGWQY